MEFQPLIALGGLAIGVLIGLTGMGGGAIMTPFLILMGVRPVIAVGTDLVQMTVTKLVGTWQHQRQETVDHRLVFRLALGSVPGALLGVGLLLLLQRVVGIEIDRMVTSVLGATLILVALIILLRARAVRGRSKELAVDTSALTPRQKVLLPLIGFGGGILVGVSSVGSGSLFLIAITLMFRMRMAKVVGTDLMHAMILTAAAGLVHFGAGHVDFALVGNVLVGSIPGVLLGSRLAPRIPERRLTTVVALVLLVLGVRIL